MMGRSSVMMEPWSANPAMTSESAPTADAAILPAPGSESGAAPAPDSWPTWKRRHHAAMQTRAVLLKRFPLAFKPFGDLKAPFKIGIRDDVAAAAPELPPYLIDAAIRDYASGRTYHQVAAVAGTPRIDLAGQPVGEVTADQAGFHARHFARISANKERRRAQHEAREAAKAAAKGDAPG